MILGKVNGAKITDKIRQIIAIIWGKNDVRNAYDVTPYGIDASPIKGMTAVYANTENNGQPIVVGYINKNQIAKPGECRMFSTNDSGSFQAQVYALQDGNILIGDSETIAAYTDFFVKWTAFNTTIQAYLVTQNAAITTAISGLGGAYVTPPPPDFSSAKTTNIKTTP